MRILLTGGGSGGPVSPVLAVANEIKIEDNKIEFLFVGTKNGPEKFMVEETGIKFVGITAAKWRRYFSIRNFIDIFVFLISLISSFRIVRRFNPDIIFSSV